MDTMIKINIKSRILKNKMMESILEWNHRMRMQYQRQQSNQQYAKKIKINNNNKISKIKKFYIRSNN